MKRNLWVGLLGIEALALLALHLLQGNTAIGFVNTVAFPLEQIGQGLRALFLSGGLGNLLSLVAFAGIGLLPVAAICMLRKRRKLCAEDGLLLLCSALLFIVLYLMVNPGLLDTMFFLGVGSAHGPAVLGITFYTAIFGYCVLRLLRLFSAGATHQLVRYLTFMLALLSAVFVYMIFHVCLGGMLDGIAALKAGNVGNEHLLGTSTFFLVLQFVADALPYALNVMIVFFTLQLLREMQVDRFSAAVVQAAERVSRWCRISLVTTVLCNIAFLLLQLVFASSLLVFKVVLQIPIFPIAFLLCVFLLARFIAENKALKDDNALFI